MPLLVGFSSKVSSVSTTAVFKSGHGNMSYLAGWRQKGNIQTNLCLLLLVEGSRKAEMTAVVFSV